MLKIYFREMLERIPVVYRFYCEVVLEEVARIAVMTGATVLLNIVILYSCRAMWGIYKETQVGQHFISKSSGYAEVILWIEDLNVVDFSLDITWLVLFVCGLVASISQFLYIRHIAYASQNALVKFIWPFILAAYVAGSIQEMTGLNSWNSAFFLAIPSSLALLAGCMNVAGNLVPEIGTILVTVYNKIRE